MGKANRKQKINSLSNNNTYGLHGDYRKTWEPDRAYEHKMSRQERLEEADLELHDGYQALANAIVVRAYRDYVDYLLFGNNVVNHDAEEFFKSDYIINFTKIPGDKFITMAKREVKLIKSLSRDYNEALFLKYKEEGKISISLTDFRNMRRDKAIAHSISILEKKLKRYGDITTDEMFLSLAKDRYENYTDENGKSIGQKIFYDLEPKRQMKIDILVESYNKKESTIKRYVDEQRRMMNLKNELAIIEARKE